MLVSTTVKFRAGSPKLKFLVLAIETTRTLLLKFPDREPDSGYGELAHISQMSQHMAIIGPPITLLFQVTDVNYTVNYSSRRLTQGFQTSSPCHKLSQRAYDNSPRR